MNSYKNGRYYNGCYNSTTYYCKGSSCSCNGHDHCSCSGNGNDNVCQTNSGYYEHAWVVNRSTPGTAASPIAAAALRPVSDYDRLTTAPIAGTPETLFAAEQYSHARKR